MLVDMCQRLHGPGNKSELVFEDINANIFARSRNKTGLPLTCKQEGIQLFAVQHHTAAFDKGS